MKKTHHLVIKWTVSKGRDSYGYSICSLWDNDKKYSTCGGGYDMLGTVFAQWLFANYKQEIIQNVEPHNRKATETNYGFFNHGNNYYLDGACGFECIETIAKLIGLKVQRFYHKNKLQAIIVEAETVKQ